jgi:KTSC domain
MSSVDSGWIDEAGYDQAKSTLHVRIGKHTYLYPNVTPARYASFQKAKSKGKWFSRHLRDAPFKRVKAKSK